MGCQLLWSASRQTAHQRFKSTFLRVVARLPSAGSVSHYLSQLVVAGDPAALASAASELLVDETGRRRLGQAARRTVEQQFSMARMTGELEALYRDVVRLNRHAG